ncbi:MAG: hypothetical protein KDC87_07555 [Planctomycetes bacterium]|nr:hypothetical protein [Planctomycetota bacterium]MCB9871378.1 hypothetical protein [Planctomycetota bacterium]MCB9888632.1 hypothetical protein [Planctomycetota bacterium]
MHTPILFSAAVAALALSIPAQNLVTNGDFETGSLAPWTESGQVLGSRVSQHDCDGAGSSYTFNCEHGGNSTQTKLPNGYYPGNAIEQNVLLVQSVEYLFMADVQVQNIQSPTSGNADAGKVEVFADGVSVGLFDFGSYTANDDERNRMCFTFTATTTGQKPLKIEFSRKYYSSVRTPTAFVDNVVLVQSPLRPIICPRGERAIGTTVNIDIEGTANAQFALYLALKKLASGVQIPGFGGAWWLDGVNVQLFIQSFDGSGKFTFPAPVPNDPNLAGLLLHWQSIEAPSAVTIGQVTSFAFYQ